MKKGEIYTGIIERIEFPNKGIFYVEGEKVVVKHTLPGQRVEAVIAKKRKGKCEGRLLSLLEKAEYELEQLVCPHSGVCGGCSYQSVPYEKQLSLKEGMVKEILDQAVEGEYVFEGILPSPLDTGYRNKMEYTFGDEVKDGPLTLGLHKRGSFYDIVSVGQCRLVHTDYGKILEATLDYFREAGARFYKKLAHTGYLRHLLIRRGVRTGEILTVLVTTTQTENGWENGKTEEELLRDWKERLLALPLEGRFAGILHTKNDSLADVVQNDGTQILEGTDFFYEELLGLKFKITPFSFFQTNSLGAEILYNKVREYIGDTAGRKIFDLYSGTGTIAQILAPVAEHVTGVEIVEEAVDAAKENAALNGLHNCEFVAGDVLKVLDTLTERPDLIILDPPREGVHPKALPKIMEYGVPRIVYVSCKPTSLARDLEVLQAGGYRVEKACCSDEFPGTGHIETVVLLSKGEIDSKKIRVEFSLEDMDMSEFQDGATYTQIKDYVLEHSGLKVSNLYISQIKRKCGIEVGKNYNLPKSEDSRQPQCPPEKEKAIREAFKYFGII